MSSAPRTPRSSKRKSEMFDGTENINPTDANVKKAKGEPASSKLPSKRTSSLPRFNAQPRTRAALADKTEESKPAATRVSARVTKPVTKEAVAPEEAKTPLKDSVVSTVTAYMSKVFNAGRSPVKTPVKSPRKSVAGAKTPLSATRRRRTNTVPTPVNQLKHVFETSFTVGEERITEIVQGLKVKNRYDLKEKTAKQLVALQDFKSALKTTLGEIQKTKEKCIETEQAANAIIHNAHIEIDELTQMNASAVAAERKLQKEVDILRVERDMIQNSLSSEADSKTKKVTTLEEENLNLKLKLQEIESQHAKLMERVAEDDTIRAQLESERSALQNEIANSKQILAEANANAHSKYEEKVERTVNEYKDEIVLVKLDVSKKEVELERLQGVKSDLEKKINEMRENQLAADSKLRDVMNHMDRSEYEITRLTSELASCKEQMIQKDTLISNTLGSIADMQKDGQEEKSKLREEVKELQLRANNLEEERLSLSSQLAAKTEEVCSVAKEIATIQEQYAQLQEKCCCNEKELASAREASVQLEIERGLRTNSEVREETERRERIAACGQLVAVQRDCDAKMKEFESNLLKETESYKRELSIVAKQLETSSINEKEQQNLIAGLESEIESLKSSLGKASKNKEQVEALSKATGEIEVLKRQLSESNALKENHDSHYTQQIAKLEEQIRASEVTRRNLHNKIQELRGNVRVFARIRPFLPGDGVDMTYGKDNPEPTAVPRPDGVSLKIKHTAASSNKDGENAGSKYRTVENEATFSFDKVFGPSMGQEAVFQEVGEFVQSALDGYNVCLFSYGQTGSGKTHTMQGSGNGSMRGIIPRAMEQVGQYKLELEKKGWTYSMEVSFIEIYNETIRDLLRNGSEEMKHEIKKDINGNTTVTDVTMLNIDPNNLQEIEGVMELAARHRSIAQTNMNEQSSRSHSIFCLHLKANNKEQNISLKGTLSLVDLAGSERLDRSGATGARLKETVAINKSLSALTDVFVAIGNKQGHVPFRNSKLTYLLQSALSGDGKTLMVSSYTCSYTHIS